MPAMPLVRSVSELERVASEDNGEPWPYMMNADGSRTHCPPSGKPLVGGELYACARCFEVNPVVWCPHVLLTRAVIADVRRARGVPGPPSSTNGQRRGVDAWPRRVWSDGAVRTLALCPECGSSSGFAWYYDEGGHAKSNCDACGWRLERSGDTWRESRRWTEQAAHNVWACPECGGFAASNHNRVWCGGNCGWSLDRDGHWFRETRWTGFRRAT